MSNGMTNGVLKLAKISNSSSLDEIKKIFNFNMDQLMVFGGGAPGEQGLPGNPGPQGDLGFCIYGNSQDYSDEESIRNYVISQEVEQTNASVAGADLFVNRYGLFKVYRGENDSRLVENIFVWTQENAGSDMNYIIAKAAEQQQIQTQTESFWEGNTYASGSGITPRNRKTVVLCGDNRYDKFYDPLATAPMTLFNDGSISFLNRNETDAYNYVVSATYRERYQDFGRSGLYIGQIHDSTISVDESAGENLPHLFMDYILRKDRRTISPYIYVKGATVSSSVTPIDNNDGAVKVIAYKDKFDREPKYAFVNGTAYVKDGQTSLTVGIEGNVINLKGVIDCALIERTQAGTINSYISIPYNGDVTTSQIELSDSDIIMGHVINSYGPEHIEFYGSTVRDLGLRNIMVSFTDTSMNIYLRSYEVPGESIVTDYNNNKIFVDISFVLNINTLQ